MSRRWSLLAGVALAALLAQTAEAQTVLRYTPQAKLSVYDSTINQSSMTHQHSYMIWDTLFGQDSESRPQPQMVESHTLSPDGLVYTFRLRTGLKFHDGTPVTSKDAVASIKRWAPKDTNALIMLKNGMTLNVVDDRTFTLTLKEPWGSVLDSMAKMSAKALYVFREQDANIDGNTPISNNIGSGPFKFVPSELVQDSKYVYAKNTDYVPRSEPASWYSGGKVVKVDRVEWVIITDAATAVAALDRGEIDWYETPPLDLLPTLKRNPNITAKVHNPNGAIGIMRPNHLHPPFNNVKARQAFMHAVNQQDYMQAAVGSDPANWKVCWAFMACGTPTGTEAGAEAFQKKDLARAKALLAESGYKGEKVVVLIPSDQQIIRDLSIVTVQNLREVGFNVEDVNTDWGGLLARRAKQEAPEAGGWSVVHTWGFGFELGSAISNYGLTTACDRSGWPGWPCDETMTKLREDWAKEGDITKRKAIGAAIQSRAVEQAYFVPLGTFFQPMAYRKNLTNIVEVAIPVFWNVEKK
ncbi:MAG: ABC transporter substrate-binding protein [Alphaproteobacteria bacterium]|nr:ABC transporter substrate-binding protein [Alphaproteobacteria bacterium]